MRAGGTMKLRPFLSFCAASLLVANSALAFDKFSVGFGGAFQAGGNFFDKPGDQTIHDQNGTDLSNSLPEYPGFAGLTLGGGGFLDLRAVEYVGIEFGIYGTTDKGSAELTLTTSGAGGIDTSKFNIKIQQKSLHMPLLVKGIIPGKIAQPFLFVGPEFVIPLKKCASPVSAADGDHCVVTVEKTSGNAPRQPADYFNNTAKYIMVTFGLGVEFKLPLPIPKKLFDIRIPLSLRGSVTPGVSGKRDDREHVRVAGTQVSVEYVTNWKFQAVANIGVAFHF
jgi:hypothetical protein